jgi:multiple sugar transport system permease protein
MSADVLSQKRKRLNKSDKNREAAGWLFAAPAIIGFLFLNLIPMALSAYYSFTDYNMIGTTHFIGLQNYITLFTGKDPFFESSIKATLSYVVLSVPANLVFAFLIAFMLNRKMFGRALFRGIFYLPSIVPGVASSFVWLLLLNPDFGLANKILTSLSLPANMFLNSTSTVIPTIVFMGIWGTGSTQVIFLAGLEDIPQNYYEAIEIDGGNAFHKFRYITLPLVSPTIFFNLVMGIIGAFQVFGQAYILTKGGPDNASLFYVFNLWRQAFSYGKMGMACAMAWLLFVVIVVMSYLVFRTSNKWVFYEGGE